MHVSQLPEDQSISSLAKYLLLVVIILVFLAGVQLYILSEQTQYYFAWTIQPPLTAAFLGAGYWGALVATILAWRSHIWVQIQTNVPTALVATGLLLIATLLHLDKFHFNSPDLITALAAWVWLIVYVAVPPLIILSLVLQRRMASTRPPMPKSQPHWARLAFGLMAIIGVLVGLTLFLIPDIAAPWWPWKLTTLTARAVGAWFAAVGATGVTVLREGDFSHLTSPLAGIVAFGVLELVALLRYSNIIDWSKPSAWLYVAFLFGTLFLSVYSLLSNRRRQATHPMVG